MPHAIDDGETGCRRMSLAREIRDDGEMLSVVVGLLTRARTLGDWPAEAAGALAGALWPDHGNSHEFEKARRLRRHLFVDLPPPSFPRGEPVPGQWSDRIRADLPDLVPFATGLGLLGG